MAGFLSRLKYLLTGGGDIGRRLAAIDRKHEARIARLDERIDALKDATLPGISRLKRRLSRVSKDGDGVYNSLLMFGHYLDNTFSVEQRKWFVEKQCMRALKYFPNIDKPLTFNEKTQWYKFNYHDPLMTRCIDKHAFKEYLADVAGAGYVVPSLGTWDNARQIDFAALPERFVLKSTWGSGSRHVLIVRNRADLDIDSTRMRLNSWIQPWENIYYHTFDWGYRDIPPRLIAEEFIDNQLYEVKLFCFGGEVKFILFSGKDPQTGKTVRSYYDAEWNYLPFMRYNYPVTGPVARPEALAEMLELAQRLSAPFPHVRVDIFVTPERLYVGELTFYTGSGTGPFRPAEWDRKAGDFFTLPQPRPEE